MNTDHYNHCVQLLNTHGVYMSDLVELVMFLQKKYIPELSDEQCQKAIENVLHKREVQNCIMTAIELDDSAINGTYSDPILEKLVLDDHGLYGIDEVLAYGICNLYGSIALTNFGYIDKEKPGVIASLNNANHTLECHTFLDDIVGAIAASAAASIAHDKN